MVTRLVRSAMEKMVYGGWACEIDDGENGLWWLGL